MTHILKSLFIFLLTFITLSLHAQEDDPYTRALEAIQFVKENGRTSLNLSGYGLNELPPEIGELTQLRYLDISSNNLKSLPRELDNLNFTCLQDFDVFGGEPDCFRFDDNKLGLFDLCFGQFRYAYCDREMWLGFIFLGFGATLLLVIVVQNPMLKSAKRKHEDQFAFAPSMSRMTLHSIVLFILPFSVSDQVIDALKFREQYSQLAGLLALSFVPYIIYTRTKRLRSRWFQLVFWIGGFLLFWYTFFYTWGMYGGW